MAKFIVDFELTGHIEVKAQTREKAVEKVASMDADKLLEHVQHCNVGKHYTDKVN